MSQGRNATRAVVAIVHVTGVAVLLAFMFAPPVIVGLLGATGTSVALVVALYQEHAAERERKHHSKGGDAG